MAQAPSAKLGTVRIRKDVRGQRSDYDEFEVGKDLGSAPFRVTQQQIDQSCERNEFHHPFYEVASPLGGTVAPVGMTYGTTRMLFSQNYSVRGLFYKWAFEFLAPIKPETDYVVSARLADKWIKNDREFVAYESVCKDAQGNVIFTTRRAHTLDYIKRTAPKVGEGGIDSADARGRDIAATTAAAQRPQLPTSESAAGTGSADVKPLATRDTPLGAPLPSFSLFMSKLQFEKWYARPNADPSGSRSLHIDADAARQEGLAAPVAVGPDIIGFAHRSAMQFFAEGWVKGGKADLTVARPTYPGEYITSNGFVKAKEQLADGSLRLICEVWVASQAGEKKVVGTVSGIVR
jgi:acyl dehydratase